MALTASSPASRVGLINSGAVNTDVDALFLKVFSGEILTTFEESNIMKGLHTVRTISSGKTAQFPATGIASATYHSAGESLLETESAGVSKYLSDIKKNEITIAIDDVLIASTFLANIDELKTHYDVRSIYAQELGKALAKRFDIAVMKTLVAGARQGATISGGKGGAQITGQTLNTGTGLLNALFEVAEKLDTNDVPAEDRFAVLTPNQYYKLISDPSTNIALNRDYGGEGSVAQGSVPMVAGIKLFKSNHLSDVVALGNASAGTTDDANAGVKNDVFDTNGVGYDGDFTSTGFVAGHKAGLGTVKLLDLATESEYQIERQGTLFVAKYAMGHGVIRPEACVEVQ
jgi:hypothetical protein